MWKWWFIWELLLRLYCIACFFKECSLVGWSIKTRFTSLVCLVVYSHVAPFPDPVKRATVQCRCVSKKQEGGTWAQLRKPSREIRNKEKQYTAYKLLWCLVPENPVKLVSWLRNTSQFLLKHSWMHYGRATLINVKRNIKNQCCGFVDYCLLTPFLFPPCCVLHWVVDHDKYHAWKEHSFNPAFGSLPYIYDQQWIKMLFCIHPFAFVIVWL